MICGYMRCVKWKGNVVALVSGGAFSSNKHQVGADVSGPCPAVIGRLSQLFTINFRFYTPHDREQDKIQQAKCRLSHYGRFYHAAW